MVQLGKSFDADSSENLREERRRTGKFIAAGSAIFLSLLGLYQALTRGTPEYAALLAPALIMFIYIAWVLYVSTKRKKVFKEDNSETENTKYLVESVTTSRENVIDLESKKESRSTHVYGRSYSIG